MKYGDVDGDGKLTKNDIQLIADYLGEYRILSSEQMEAADVDGDGEVTTFDNALIKRAISGTLWTDTAGGIKEATARIRLDWARDGKKKGTGWLLWGAIGATIAVLLAKRGRK